MEKVGGLPQESLPEFKEMLDCLGEGVMVLDRRLHVSFINEYMLSLTEKTLKEVHGRRCFKAFYGRSSPCPNCVAQKVIQSGTEAKAVYPWEASLDKWLELNAYPVFSNDELVAVVQIIRDVTKRRDFEEKLRESEERYRTLVETMNYGLWVINERGEVTFWNKGMREIIGYSSDEAMGRPIHSFMPQENRERLEELTKQPIGASTTYEVELATKNGGRIPVLVNAAPLYDSQGNYKGSFAVVRDISEKKWQTKEFEEYSKKLMSMVEERTRELRESEEKYRSLVENANDGICFVDIDGRFKFFNPKFAEMFGYVREELYKKDFFELIHPEDLSRVKEIHESMTRERTNPKRYEYKGLTWKGEVRYIETNAVPIEVNGRVIGTQMITRDVTSRQKAEKRMVLLYYLSRSLSSTLSLPEVLNKIVKVTSVLLECFNCFILLLEDDEKTLRCVAANDNLWEKAKDLTIDINGVSLAAETVRIRTPIVVEEAHKSPIVNQRLRRYFGHKSLLSVPLIVKDKVLGAIVLGETQRTRRFTEEEVELAATIASSAAVAIENARLYEEIWKTKNFLNNVIESSADSIITTDLEGRITSFSRGAEGLFGFSADEMIGRSVLELYPEELRSNRIKWVERLQKEEVLRNVKTTVYSSTGEIVHISVSLSLLRDAEGKAIGTVEVARDITPEVKARERLKEAYKRLKELDKLKDELISNVSHELRTPITIAKTAMELALRESNPLQRQKLLELGISAMKRQNNIVGDLICIHEMQTKNYTLSKEPVDLVYLANNVAEEMQPTALTKNIHLEVRATQEIPRVEADFNEIKHALRNLVDNAIKFNRPGGAVYIELKRGWGCVKVSVRDTGIGIPPKYIEKIFERFYQIDSGPERQYGGTGMGLAIVKNIVEAHKGRVEVKSTKRKGSTFTFTLPI